jgi:hypothetical protein
MNEMIPALDERFHLVLDGDAVDPMAIIRKDAGPREYWQFKGPKITGLVAGVFILVKWNYSAGSVLEIRERVSRGRLAEGEWLEAFKVKFPNYDGRSAIGFGGSEWERWIKVGRRRRAHFVSETSYIPILNENYQPKFVAVGRGFDEFFRWLVRVD